MNGPTALGPAVPLGRELERLVTVAPFGFQLWDAALGARVADGILATGSGPGGIERPVTAGPSGTFSVHHRPSSFAFTMGAGDDAFWASPPSDAARWTVTVRDTVGRFLPFRFDVEGAIRIARGAREVCGIGGPPPGVGVLGLDTSPPSTGMPILPLFSAPARPVPAGFTSVSVQLEDVAGGPVAFAIVRLTLPRSRPVHGATDERGVAVIPVPYPELEDTHASPPVAAPRPLHGQTWPLTVEVFAGLAGAGDPTSAGRPPDLCAVVDQLDDPPTAIVGSSPPGTSITTSLEFGRQLVVSTPGRSELTLDVGSPPSP